MNWLEWIAAALGVINVTLIVQRRVWNYPFGIAMVVLYSFVFLEEKLYSDALLQVFFLVVQVYGWWSWTAARSDSGVIPVGTLSDRARVAWVGGTIAGGIVLGLAMDRYTDAAAPFADAGVAATSVAAQILMARRRVESWVLWILVDIVAIGLFASRELYWTSGLYAVFLVLACAGLVSWVRALRETR